MFLFLWHTDYFIISEYFHSSFPCHHYSILSPLLGWKRNNRIVLVCSNMVRVFLWWFRIYFSWLYVSCSRKSGWSISLRSWYNRENRFFPWDLLFMPFPALTRLTSSAPHPLLKSPISTSILLLLIIVLCILVCVCVCILFLEYLS